MAYLQYANGPFSENQEKNMIALKQFNTFILNDSESNLGHGYSAGTDKEMEREEAWVGILTK